MAVWPSEGAHVTVTALEEQVYKIYLNYNQLGFDCRYQWLQVTLFIWIYTQFVKHEFQTELFSRSWR